MIRLERTIAIKKVEPPCDLNMDNVMSNVNVLYKKAAILLLSEEDERRILWPGIKSLYLLVG